MGGLHSKNLPVPLQLFYAGVFFSYGCKGATEPSDVFFFYLEWLADIFQLPKINFLVLAIQWGFHWPTPPWRKCLSVCRARVYSFSNARPPHRSLNREFEANGWDYWTSFASTVAGPTQLANPTQGKLANPSHENWEAMDSHASSNLGLQCKEGCCRLM